MANVKLSELPVTTTVNTNDTIPINDIPNSVLKRIAISSLDVRWITRSTVTAKGDLLAGTGAGAIGRLGSGTNGQVLTADSATASGLKWADPTGGNIASDINSAASKATPVDADELALVDSAASFGLKKLTWANLKATLKTYFDTFYVLSSVLTTKGDIFVRTASGIVRLAIGNDGEVLTADSSLTAGVKWAAGGGGGGSATPDVSGTDSTPIDVDGTVGITFAGSNYFNIKFVKSDGGAVNISANPQIQAGTLLGQRLLLIFKDDTDTLTLEDGNGLSLKGTFVSENDRTLEFIWNGALWVELYRS